MMEKIEADIAVVGSGVAGSIAAWKLASAGHKVVVLESGPGVDRRESVDRFKHALNKDIGSPYKDTPQSPRPRDSALDRYYVQQGPDTFQATYERQVGGTTWHWLGTSNRLLPSDFRLKSEFGVGVDWPIQYGDLEPWYVQGEAALGVSGTSDDDHGSPRSAPYPMPPIPISYLDEKVSAAAKKIGLKVKASPQARNSVVYDGRPACCGSSNCIPICPIGAKYDASVHAKKARTAGARVIAEAVVVRVEIGPDRRVSAVRFKRYDGGEGQLRAKLFIIAANAMETAKLLLLSTGERSPQGVANSSGLVGRNLMDHPGQISFAFVNEDLYPFRGPQSTAGIEDFRASSTRNAHAAFRTQIQNVPIGAFSPTNRVKALVDRGLSGKELRDELEKSVSRSLVFLSWTEQLPASSNRIVPDPGQLDSFGVPRPRIEFKVDDYTRGGFAAARDMHERVFKAMGASTIHHVDQWRSPGHVIGTSRMGNDPRSSVVDANCVTHDHPNLMLLGSGVFPTCGTAHPTLTIATLSLRAADFVHRDWRRWA